MAVVALSVVAVASGGTAGGRTGRTTRGSVCGALMNDPQAVKDKQDLRAEHQKDRQARYLQYGSEPSGTYAQGTGYGMMGSGSGMMGGWNY